MAIKTAKVKKTTATNMAATTTNTGDHRIPAPTKQALRVFGKPSKTDVNGSYTGRPINEKEKPVQDADDL